MKKYLTNKCLKKMCNTFSHQGNENQNYIEIVRMVVIKKTNHNKWEGGHLISAGGNVK
jgi:hypothetical protein